jgi:FixJ family two-component response regulator
MQSTSPALPPLRTRGCIALLDDNADFVAMLETLLEDSDYRLVSFTEPAPLHAFLAGRAHLLQQEQVLLSAILRAQVETLGTPAIEALRFFARPQRLELPLVLVSDYAMPAETGLSVCARHRYAGFERILLTGVADTHVAVSAFNAGLIEQFVRKQSPSIAQDIASALRGRLQASAERRGAQLATALAPEFAGALCNPVVQGELLVLLAARDVREYMVLGDPQGILGITTDGDALWIQLETEASLEDMDDLLQFAGVDGESSSRVAARQTLVAADFMQQVGLRPTEAAAVLVSDAPMVIAAVHGLALDSELLPAVPAGGG